MFLFTEEITSTEIDTTRKNRILYSSKNISSTSTTLTTGNVHYSNNKRSVASQESSGATTVTQSYSSTPHKNNNNNNNNVKNRLQNLPVEPKFNQQHTDSGNVGDFVEDSNENVMLQMQEFDQSGSSQLRNVSVEELVASGHIILDGE